MDYLVDMEWKSEYGPFATCTRCRGGFVVNLDYTEYGDYPYQVCNPRRRDLVSDCPKGTFYDEEVEDCQECGPHCDECDGEQCHVCESGATLLDGQCKLPCSDNVPHCSKCSESDNQVCESCDNNLTLDSVEQTCSCPDNMLMKTTSEGARCQPCHSVINGCSQCDFDSQTCERCLASYFLSDSGSCVTDPCGERDVFGRCVSCNSKEGLNLYPEGDTCMTFCSSPYVLKDNKCVHDCKPGMYQSQEGCRSCEVEGCRSCLSKNSCIECEPGSSCSLTCPVGSVYDYEGEGTCVKQCPTGAVESWRARAGYNLPYCLYCSEGCEECVEGEN